MIYSYSQAVGQVGFVQSIYDTGNLILEIDGHHWEFSPMVCTVNVQADEEGEYLLGHKAILV